MVLLVVITTVIIEAGNVYLLSNVYTDLCLFTLQHNRFTGSMTCRS